MLLAQALSRAPAVLARPMAASDQAFLRGLYISARDTELAAACWPAAQVQVFLEQQFELQDRYYHAHYPQAEFLVLSRDGQPFGRLYWNESPTEASLMD